VAFEKNEVERRIGGDDSCKEIMHDAMDSKQHMEK
jgi:hypothetical protein